MSQSKTRIVGGIPRLIGERYTWMADTAKHQGAARRAQRIARRKRGVMLTGSAGRSVVLRVPAV